MFNRTEKLIFAATAIYCSLLAGCYSWTVTDQVDKAEITKIETDFAPQFCSELLGQPMQHGCAVRIVNTTTKQSRCVMVVLPGDSQAVRHEGGHCMGQDH